jgi:hypothetical protein
MNEERRAIEPEEDLSTGTDEAIKARAVATADDDTEAHGGKIFSHEEPVQDGVAEGNG